MFRILWMILLAVIAVAPMAFAAEQFVVDQPYAPLVLDKAQIEGSLWLGELQEYPHLYAFTVPASTTVRVELRAVDHTNEQPLFAGIMVRDRAGEGVQEVARLGQTENWSLEKSPRSKMSYQVRQPFETTLAPGAYRFEVSTPDNQGRYVLQFGTGDAGAGYFASLGDIREIQAFHGYGWWHIFRTTHIYVPFLLIGILLVMGYTWQYARRRKIL